MYYKQPFKVRKTQDLTKTTDNLKVSTTYLSYADLRALVAKGFEYPGKQSSSQKVVPYMPCLHRDNKY